MDMKDVYAALEKLDNGADLITAIKGEINTLNDEAKKNRIAGEHTAEKLKDVLAGLALEAVHRWPFICPVQYMRCWNTQSC